MPRPSSHADQALLASGRELLAAHGCAGLSVRVVAEHAGVRPAMLHYHFGSKEAFLGHVLQSFYEEVFSQLQPAAQSSAPPLARLHDVLMVLGRFTLRHGAVVGRIWADAGNGQTAAVAFFRRNAPRHLRLLLGLLHEAQRAGDIAPMPALQRLTFLMGAVVAPVFIGQRAAQLQLADPSLMQRLPDEVLSDTAMQARARMAIAALRSRPGETP